MSDFITLRKCFSEIEAHHIKNILDNEGIFNQIVNGTISQVYNFHTPADGGVLIKVHARDLAIAEAAIDSDIHLDLLSTNYWDKTEIPEENLDHVKKGKPKILYLVLFILIVLAIMAAVASQI